MVESRQHFTYENTLLKTSQRCTTPNSWQFRNSYCSDVDNQPPVKIFPLKTIEKSPKNGKKPIDEENLMNWLIQEFGSNNLDKGNESSENNSSVNFNDSQLFNGQTRFNGVPLKSDDEFRKQRQRILNEEQMRIEQHHYPRLHPLRDSSIDSRTNSNRPKNTEHSIQHVNELFTCVDKHLLYLQNVDQKIFIELQHASKTINYLKQNDQAKNYMTRSNQHVLEQRTGIDKRNYSITSGWLDLRRNLKFSEDHSRNYMNNELVLNGVSINSLPKPHNGYLQPVILKRRVGARNFTESPWGDVTVNSTTSPKHPEIATKGGTSKGNRKWVNNLSLSSGRTLNFLKEANLDCTIDYLSPNDSSSNIVNNYHQGHFMYSQTSLNIYDLCKSNMTDQSKSSLLGISKSDSLTKFSISKGFASLLRRPFKSKSNAPAACPLIISAPIPNTFRHYQRSSSLAHLPNSNYMNANSLLAQMNPLNFPLKTTNKLEHL